MNRRPSHAFRPDAEVCEERSLLSRMSVLPGVNLPGVPGSPLPLPVALHTPMAYPAVRPNTPVLPYGAGPLVLSFIDPSTHIIQGEHVVLGQQTFVGPQATLDASNGFIKIGGSSAILDNSVLQANPNREARPSGIVIGDGVAVDIGATVLGPATLGAYNAEARPTYIGSNALIDRATIQPGAMVGALARVGPGVTVPSGFRVLPGANVTTDAEASDPALGKVVPVTQDDINAVNLLLNHSISLANGYANLYQGNSATGSSPALPSSVNNVFNGNLAAVSGTGQQPGPPLVPFEPNNHAPGFLSPHQGVVQGSLANFPARITGQANFNARAKQVAHLLGRRNAIRADDGQPIAFASAIRTGNNVSINSPIGSAGPGGIAKLTPQAPNPGPSGPNVGPVSVVPITTKKLPSSGKLSIGQNFQADSHSVILGGPQDASYSIGNNVTIGSGAVVSESNLGDNVTIGSRAYVSNSTVPAGTNVPAGTILINNQVVGQIQW